MAIKLANHISDHITQLYEILHTISPLLKAKILWNKSFPGVGTTGRGLGKRKGRTKVCMWLYFVSIYEKIRMKPIEIVLRREEEGREKTKEG
jgi:hypothetical protein